ncbi:MAG: fibronectin type III domain-containing protein [Weeksellaceae bacterium]
MKAYTLLKQGLTKRQIGILAVAVAVPIVIGFLIFAFMTVQTETKANDEAPQGLNIVPVDGQTATVSWNTGTDTLATVEYGTEPNPDSFVKFAFSDTPTTNHNLQIDKLTPGTTYYFRVRVGDNVYDNEGQLWSFTTPGGDTISPSPTPSIEISGEGEPEATAEGTIIPVPTTASPSAGLTAVPTPTGPTPTTNPNVTPTSTIGVCQSTNCTTIKANLGTSCTTQDYVRCLYTPTSTTPVPTAVPATSAPTPTGNALDPALKELCMLTFMQPNSCGSWIWDDIETKVEACREVFTRYFIQCKSTSWESTDPAIWYCNDIKTSNTATVPCSTEPTPNPLQSVFCRVRAEDEVGGAAHATAWTYGGPARCPTSTPTSTPTPTATNTPTPTPTP